MTTLTLLYERLSPRLRNSTTSVPCPTLREKVGGRVEFNWLNPCRVQKWCYSAVEGIGPLYDTCWYLSLIQAPTQSLDLEASIIPTKLVHDSSPPASLASLNMSSQHIIHAYRHLYRSLLQAVRFSKPARFTARDQLRRAFREPGAAFDEQGIQRTIWFLKAAAKAAGLEHRILRSLLKTAYVRQLAMTRTSWSHHVRAATTQARPSP